MLFERIGIIETFFFVVRKKGRFMNIKILRIFGRLGFMILIPLATLVHVYLNRYRQGTHVIKIFVDDIDTL